MDTVDLGGPSTADPELPGKGKRLRIVKTSEKTPGTFEDLASGPFPSGAVRGYYDSSRYPTVGIVWTEEDLARYGMTACCSRSGKDEAGAFIVFAEVFDLNLLFEMVNLKVAVAPHQ